MAMQQQVLKGQRELGQAMGTITQSLVANSAMLGEMLKGEHDCPRWLVVVPKPPPKSTAARVLESLKPKTWLNQTVLLHFVCPISMCAVGEGFELQLQRGWVKRYGPAIRVGLTLLKLGAGTARLAGLPIPSLGELMAIADEHAGGVAEQVRKQAAWLEQVSEHVASELEGAGLGFVNEWAREALEEQRDEFTDVSMAKQPPKQLPKQVQQTVQQSYAEVRRLLESLEPTGQPWDAKVRDPKRCGLRPAVHRASGDFDWVASDKVAAYEQNGRALLGGHV